MGCAVHAQLGGRQVNQGEQRSIWVAPAVTLQLTQQAIQLGFIPRMTIKHTSTAAGQIYIPVINWALMIAVILLYYFLILRFSEVEYREVISEKFGE